MLTTAARAREHQVVYCGLEVLRLLKAQRPNLRVVLYTGMDHNQEEIEGMLRLGAHQYLRKSTMGEMLKAVQSAVAA